MDSPDLSHSEGTTDDEENTVEVKNQWKQTCPPLIRELYSTLIHKQRPTIQTFHLWLRLLEHNLIPNARGPTVHYHTVPSLHTEYDLVRIWLNADLDKGLNRKMRVQILAFSTATTLAGQSDEDENKFPWDLFLRDLRNQHDLISDENLLPGSGGGGDYDCFVAYKQYSRLYSVQTHADPECPIIKECRLNFGSDMAQQYDLPPLWKDSNDQGPVWEFKTHFGLICHFLRAFAWDINIPYVYK